MASMIHIVLICACYLLCCQIHYAEAGFFGWGHTCEEKQGAKCGYKTKSFFHSQKCGCGRSGDLYCDDGICKKKEPEADTIFCLRLPTSPCGHRYKDQLDFFHEKTCGCGFGSHCVDNKCSYSGKAGDDNDHANDAAANPSTLSMSSTTRPKVAKTTVYTDEDKAVTSTSAETSTLIMKSSQNEPATSSKPTDSTKKKMNKIALNTNSDFNYTTHIVATDATTATLKQTTTESTLQPTVTSEDAKSSTTESTEIVTPVGGSCDSLRTDLSAVCKDIYQLIISSSEPSAEDFYLKHCGD